MTIKNINRWLWNWKIVLISLELFKAQFACFHDKFYYDKACELRRVEPWGLKELNSNLLLFVRLFFPRLWWTRRNNDQELFVCFFLFASPLSGTKKSKILIEKLNETIHIFYVVKRWVELSVEEEEEEEALNQNKFMKSIEVLN